MPLRAYPLRIRLEALSARGASFGRYYWRQKEGRETCILGREVMRHRTTGAIDRRKKEHNNPGRNSTQFPHPTHPTSSIIPGRLTRSFTQAHSPNLHLKSSSPLHTPSPLSPLLSLSSLFLLILACTPQIAPTTPNPPTKYPNATACPTAYRGASPGLYSCVPITAPKFPTVICSALAVARFVCPLTFTAGQASASATEG